MKIYINIDHLFYFDRSLFLSEKDSMGLPCYWQLNIIIGLISKVKYFAKFYGFIVICLTSKRLDLGKWHVSKMPFR